MEEKYNKELDALIEEFGLNADHKTVGDKEVSWEEPPSCPAFALSELLEKFPEKSDENDWFGDIAGDICQSDNQVFKQHLYQDCHVNMLQAMRGWAERVKPGYAIKRAIDSNNPDGMEYLLTELKNHGSSSLPTLYYYFRPRNLKEIAEMEQELRDMSQLHYISEKHVWMIKNLVLQCREYRYRHQHDGSRV